MTSFFPNAWPGLDRNVQDMRPTYEEIEIVARAMFGFNHFPELPRLWSAIDQGERNHWMKLAEADLLDRLSTAPVGTLPTPDSGGDRA